MFVDSFSLVSIHCVAWRLIIIIIIIIRFVKRQNVKRLPWRKLLYKCPASHDSSLRQHDFLVFKTSSLWWIIIVSTIHCVSKTSHLWLPIIFTYKVRLQQFLAEMLLDFPTLPNYCFCTTCGNRKAGKWGIASFHLNAACFFTKNMKHSLKCHLVSGQSWTTLHCQNDRLGAPDRRT